MQKPTNDLHSLNQAKSRPTLRGAYLAYWDPSRDVVVVLGFLVSQRVFTPLAKRLTSDVGRQRMILNGNQISRAYRTRKGEFLDLGALLCIYGSSSLRGPLRVY